MTIKPFVSRGELTPSSVHHDTILQHEMEQLSMMPQENDINAMSGPVSTVPDHTTATQVANVSDVDLQDQSNISQEECERKADETDEQFKERVLNQRAAQLFAVMKPKLSAGMQLSFSEVAPRHSTRKEVAQTFYSLLLLKKQQVLKIEQQDSYVPVTICKGSRFETNAT